MKSIFKTMLLATTASAVLFSCTDLEEDLVGDITEAVSVTAPSLGGDSGGAGRGRPPRKGGPGRSSGRSGRQPPHAPLVHPRGHRAQAAVLVAARCVVRLPALRVLPACGDYG